MVWMYLVSLFGFSFAILSMAEISSMCVSTGGAPCCAVLTDNLQGSYIRRTVSVSDKIYRVIAVLLMNVSCETASMVACASIFDGSFTDSLVVRPILTYPSNATSRAS